MWPLHALGYLAAGLTLSATYGLPTAQHPLILQHGGDRAISPHLFSELEELARIVDISYCVGTSGVQKVSTIAPM